MKKNSNYHCLHYLNRIDFIKQQEAACCIGIQHAQDMQKRRYIHFNPNT